MTTQQSIPELSKRTRGWLQFLHRKATTPDDWSRHGEPHEWWDNKSTPPVLSFHRFDLIESTYALNLMADITPAWREVYSAILDQLVKRYPTFWGASDWLTQIGEDPDREHYPEDWYKTWIPDHLRGKYDTPGWTANGVEPWGLAPDPIGAQGNLFFRGNLNLMLSAHLYVSGDRKWNQPFDVTGYDDASFSWTHDRVVDYLTTDWANRPEGPHCENTKIWPYCLTMAGLGLKQYDVMLGGNKNDVFSEWLDFARNHYMSVTNTGGLDWLVAYYDPIVNYMHKGGPSSGLGMAFYLLPQDRKLAEIFYHAAVEKIGWNNPAKPVRSLPDPRQLLLGVVLSRELGDTKTHANLSAYVEKHYEPAFDTDTGEFGWGFQFGERYPRGQLNALLIMAETGQENSWWDVYNRPKMSKFDEPTLEGVDFPALGISRAYYDTKESVLHIATCAASPRDQGADTRFRITMLPEGADIRVRCNGQNFEQWERLVPTSIRIDSKLADRSFDILISNKMKKPKNTDSQYENPDARLTTNAGARSVTNAAAIAQFRRTIKTATSQLISQPAGCPCCSI